MLSLCAVPSLRTRAWHAQASTSTPCTVCSTRGTGAVSSPSLRSRHIQALRHAGAGTRTCMCPCSPPEELVMPKTFPRAPLPVLAALVSPLVWLYGRPDLFDTYSAGVLLLQMSGEGLCWTTCMC